MTHKNSNTSRPTAADIEQRAALIKGFRHKKDIEDETKLVQLLAQGKSVDEDMGGAYLTHTYPDWQAEDFESLARLLRR